MKTKTKKKVTIAKGVKLPKAKVAKLKKKPGMSNMGEYKNVSKDDFAGKTGTYPINTLERAKSALKLAHNAKDPEAIKAKVYKKWPQLKPKKK